MEELDLQDPFGSQGDLEDGSHMLKMEEQESETEPLMLLWKP